MTSTWDRLKSNWVYGGSLAGLLLLGLWPTIGGGWTLALTAVFLQLPVYMLHQFEEHDGDRFRQWINTNIGHGLDVLPLGAVFVINIFGVWVLNLVSFTLAATLGIGWGLIGIYTTLFNALVHIGPAIGRREYNPGLVTAIILFLPVGLFGAWAVNATGEVTMTQQVVAIATAVLLHAAIIVCVVSNLRRLRKSGKA